MSLDVIFLTDGSEDSLKFFERHKDSIPYAKKIVTTSTSIQAFKEASKVSNTSCFFVVDHFQKIQDTTILKYEPTDYDKSYAHVWRYSGAGNHTGLYLFSKKILRTDETVLENLGDGLKYIDIAIPGTEQFDIIFLSYDEPNATANWESLVARFPRAKRVHKVQGILEAHKMAAMISKTDNFYVVDGDSQIIDGFEFPCTINPYDLEHYVHIWKCHNPVNKLEYGYGGVKLFNKFMFSNMNETIVDMTTILGEGVKLVDEIASITNFNSDAFHAFRGAFRECCKLASGSIKNQVDEETKQRLEIWCTVATGDFANEVLQGANLGKEYGIKYADSINKLKEINNFDWLFKTYRKLIMKKKEDELLYTKFNKIDTRTIINLTNLLYDPSISISLEEIRDCLSTGQLMSKFWLIDELNNIIDDDKELTIMILGGWIGSLANLMFQHYKKPENIKRIVSVDIDPKCAKIADLFNLENMCDGWRFKAVTNDMMTLNYARTEGLVIEDDKTTKLGIDWDIAINTSCEHIDDVSEWFALLPKGKMAIVQSNNYFACNQHVSCVGSIEEFEKQCRFSKVLFKGTLPLQIYDRYMIIGIV